MTTEELSLHDWLLLEIAGRRFPFPNRKHPNWTSYPNTTVERTMRIETNDWIVYPDIVVLEGRRVVMLGEVETDTGINQTEALQWLEYSGLCGTFYLYVPEGYEEATAELLRDNEIDLSGLRSYTIEDSELEITNV